MTTSARVDPRTVSTSPDMLVVEASDARLPVGAFPDCLHVGDVTYWRTQRVERDRDGDLIAVIYDCGVPSAPRLHVLND